MLAGGTLDPDHKLEGASQASEHHRRAADHSGSAACSLYADESVSGIPELLGSVASSASRSISCVFSLYGLSAGTY
jgi:hypothetical protein